MSLITKLFSGGANEVIKSVGGVLDNLITNKEELAKAKLEAEKEINRHFETLQANATREYELEIKDRESARLRETEYVKTTGHADYIMWLLVVFAILIFGFIVWNLIRGDVPEKNRELLTNIIGIVEGLLIAIYTYYWGSSAKRQK